MQKFQTKLLSMTVMKLYVLCIVCLVLNQAATFQFKECIFSITNAKMILSLEVAYSQRGT